MVDQAKIIIRAGKGGDGAISFRREKYVPKGGPDGGDGGRGGSVYMVTDSNVNTLRDFSHMQKFEAEDGGKGGSKQMSGKAGLDVEIRVPLGTIVTLKRIPLEDIGDKQIQVKGMGKGMMGTLIEQKREKIEEEMVIDFDEEGQRYLIARGGKSGRGNQHFKSSVNTTPRHAFAGQRGEEFEVVMELKLLADVGLIGLPNAGKSTMLSILSNAKPKIANYAFTTLEPNIGVMKHKGKNVVLADIPGLIEGASEGKGLGIQFLKHVERTKMLVHLIAADIDPEEVWKNYQVVRKELKNYATELVKKKEVVVVNKIDLVDEEIMEEIKKVFAKHKVKVMFVSAGTGAGVEELKLKLIA